MTSEEIYKIREAIRTRAAMPDAMTLSKWWRWSGDILTRILDHLDDAQTIIAKQLPHGRVPGDVDAWRTAHNQLEQQGKELERLRPVHAAAKAMVSQPMLKHGDAATWGDVAQSHQEGPRLLGVLMRAVEAAEKA